MQSLWRLWLFLEKHPPFESVLAFSVIYMMIGTALAVIAGTPNIFSGFSDNSWVYNAGGFGVAVFLVYCFSMPTRFELVGLALAGALGIILLFDTSLVRSVDWPLSVPLGLGPIFAFVSPLCVLFMIRKCNAANGVAKINQELLLGIVFIVIYSFSSFAFLYLTPFFHPKVYDGRLFLIDSSLGFSPSVLFPVVSEKIFGLKAYLKLLYFYSYMGFVLVFAAQVVSKSHRRWNVVTVWFGVSVIGLICYNFIPVAGPQYFFEKLYPHNLPELAYVSSEPLTLWPALRNGMPSLHFGWALAACIVSFTMTMRWLKWLQIIILGSVFLSTMSLGEHYLVDLIVAIPFVICVMSYFILDVPWTVSWRRNVFLGSLFLFVLWETLILFYYDFLIAYRGFTGCVSLMTIVVSFLFVKVIVHAKHD